MTDIDALKEVIEESGMTIEAVCKKSGIQKGTLYNRFKCPDFRLSEIDALTETLRLSVGDRNRIFFPK